MVWEGIYRTLLVTKKRNTSRDCRKVRIIAHRLTSRILCPCRRSHCGDLREIPTHFCQKVQGVLCKNGQREVQQQFLQSLRLQVLCKFSSPPPKVATVKVRDHISKCWRCCFVGGVMFAKLGQCFEYIEMIEIILCGSCKASDASVFSWRAQCFLRKDSENLELYWNCGVCCFRRRFFESR